MKSKLTKSHQNKMISGVCAGIAEYYEWDPTVVRILFVIGAFVIFGSTILLYIILAIIMPDY
jgi:phage shock protein PspC (stress-responsive transcriptional regulator)